MDTWTKQLGYPVVTTKRINATHLEVEQKRFSLDPPGVGKSEGPTAYKNVIKTSILYLQI